MVVLSNMTMKYDDDEEEEVEEDGCPLKYDYEV